MASGVLVDASVWVHFFRSGQTKESLHLDRLLEVRSVRTCAPIRAEVISGARTERERRHLKEWFGAVDLLELPENLWERVEESRFRLARRGHQASIVDLIIACTADHHRVPLWTLDEDFLGIHRVIGFSRYLLEETDKIV